MVVTLYLFVVLLSVGKLFARESVWNSQITEKNDGKFLVFPNYLYKDSFVSVTAICQSLDPKLKIIVIWMLVEMNCMEDMYNTQPVKQSSLISFLDKKRLDTAPIWHARKPPLNVNYTTVRFQVSLSKKYNCGDKRFVTLEDESNYDWFIAQVPNNIKNVTSSLVKFWKILRNHSGNETNIESRVARTWTAGMYHFLLFVVPGENGGKFTANVHVEMRSSYGYLSAINFPLLPYSAVTAFLYLFLGTLWMIVWVRAQQHSTKIHLVIGVVNVAGGITNTMLFIEQATVNSNGQGFPGLDWIAMILTYIQASLTTMLLMVVSTGHGITRPTLHRCLVVGIALLTSLRFVASLAIMVVTNESLRVQYRLPVVSLTISAIYGIIMLIIGAFIMIQSILTAIHLWYRKHSHQIIFFSVFMVACIISFIAEIFLLGIGYGWFSSCRQDWKHEWIFNNFGSVITLLLLIVLMWLWRPTDITQSYSFQPLDNIDKDAIDALDENDEDETEIFAKD